MFLHVSLPWLSLINLAQEILSKFLNSSMEERKGRRKGQRKRDIGIYSLVINERIEYSSNWNIEIVLYSTWTPVTSLAQRSPTTFTSAAAPNHVSSFSFSNFTMQMNLLGVWLKCRF